MEERIRGGEKEEREEGKQEGKEGEKEGGGGLSISSNIDEIK